MVNVIAFLVLAVILFFAIRYLVKVKKSGGCAGCPNSGVCPHHGNAGSHNCGR